VPLLAVPAKLPPRHRRVELTNTKITQVTDVDAIVGPADPNGCLCPRHEPRTTRRETSPELPLAGDRSVDIRPSWRPIDTSNHERIPRNYVSHVVPNRTCGNGVYVVRDIRFSECHIHCTLETSGVKLCRSGRQHRKENASESPSRRCRASATYAKLGA